MLLDYFIRITVSFFCGLILGLERRSKQHAVGIRTLALISVSSTLLSILSIVMAENANFPGDPTRVAAGVVTGIGFIGGGAILRQGLNIRGLTTAAIIFTASAIGLACGAALYIPTGLTLVVAIIVLFMMNKLERKLFPAAKNKLIQITIKDSDFDQKDFRKILEKNGIIIHDLNIEYTADNLQTVLSYTVKTPDKLDAIKLSNELKEMKGINKLILSDK